MTLFNTNFFFNIYSYNYYNFFYFYIFNKGNNKKLFFKTDKNISYFYYPYNYSFMVVFYFFNRYKCFIVNKIHYFFETYATNLCINYSYSRNIYTNHHVFFNLKHNILKQYINILHSIYIFIRYLFFNTFFVYNNIYKYIFIFINYNKLNNYYFYRKTRLFIFA